MDIIEAEQLFGAPPGKTKGVTLQITAFDRGAWGVWIMVHPINRQKALNLRVTCTEEQGIGTVVGALIPLLNRSSNLSVNFARRSLWAVHNRLGMMGYEVQIDGCGREPNH